MKKRIVAMFMAVFALLSCFAVSVGAEEVATAEVESDVSDDVPLITDEVGLFSVRDTLDVQISHPYYYFTISVGDYIGSIAPDFGAYCDTSWLLVAEDGVYTSGKVAGDWDIGGNGERLYFFHVEVWHQFYIGASGDYKGDNLLIKEEDGIVTTIYGVGPQNRGASYERVHVMLSTQSWNGSEFVDVKDDVDAFVEELRDIGIDVHYTEGVAGTGIVAHMFDNFKTAVVGLANGAKGSFTNLLYENGLSGEISTLVMFIFIIAGISIAMTVFFMIFRLIRFNRQR